MPGPITFTLDLEDLRTSPAQESRVEQVTEGLLDRLAQLDVRGTVFCVADLARRHPALLARIAADGHELGVHGLHHAPIDTVEPAQFDGQTREARKLVEDAAGVAVTGYRAPQFSLVPETLWATDILAEQGFTYSSSVLPASSPLYGWPGAPLHPFRWPSGLVELPCPMVELAGVVIPFLGGAYLRVLPQALRRHGLRTVPDDTLLWTYCHPWEFDPDERFYVYEDGGWLVSRIGWLNRKGMLARVERTLAGGAGAPLGVLAAALEDLPTFRPPPVERERGLGQGLLRRRPPAA